MGFLSGRLPERAWKLGDDVLEGDSVLDGFSFEDLATALYSNEPVIDEAAVRKTVKDIFDRQVEDMNFLIENNMEEIIHLAKGFGSYDEE